MLTSEIKNSDHQTLFRINEFKNLLSYNQNPEKRHEVQLKFHSNNAKIRLFLGGNRSGKTTAGVVEVLWLCLGIHPFHQPWNPPIFARICCTDFRNGIKKIIVPKVQEYLPPHAYQFNKEDLVFTLNNGSTIELMSYEQDDAKFGGTARHIVHMDEEPPRYSIFSQNLMRTVDYGGFIIQTMTPIELQMTWTYEELINISEDDERSKDVEVFQCGIMHNPFLSSEALREVIRNIREDQKSALLHGEFFPQSSKIYPMYDENVHVRDNIVPNPAWMWVLAIDPHLREPTYCIFAGIDEENRIYIFKEMIQRKLIPAFAKDILEYCEAYKKQPAYTLIDHNAKTPDVITGIDIQKSFAEAGLGTVLASKDVEAGIERVRNCLHASILESEGVMNTKANPLYISRNCVITRRQFRSYMWDDFTLATMDKHNPKQVPRKKEDHAVDCIRYILNSRPTYHNEYTYTKNPNERYLRRVGGIARF